MRTAYCKEDAECVYEIRCSVPRNDRKCCPKSGGNGALEIVVLRSVTRCSNVFNVLTVVSGGIRELSTRNPPAISAQESM